MTKVNIIDIVNKSIKHISEMKDGEYGIVTKANHYDNLVGHLVVRINFEKDPSDKTSKNWDLIYELDGSVYISNLHEDIWIRPVEQIDIRIIK